MESKHCKDCNQTLPLTDFSRHPKSADGYQYRCRQCASAAARQWAKDHPEQHRENERRYRQTEEYKAKRKAYLEGKREERRAVATDWYNRNREAIRERRRIHEAKPEVREATRQRAREWYHANKQRRAEWVREYNYGLSAEEYESLLESQARCCAICRGAFVLNVDHDHVDGRVRGLLCATCNHGIGNFKDSPGLLRAAADYLQR